MGLIPHLITLALCIAVLVMTVVNTLMGLRYLRRDMVQLMMMMYCGFQAATIISFTVNQTVWVLGDFESAIGTAPALAWLAYDYLNKLFHLTTAMMAYYFLKCRKDRAARPKQPIHHYCPVLQTSGAQEVKMMMEQVSKNREKAEEERKKCAE